MPPDKPRRWDTDERGHGVADARSLAPRIEALAEHARRTDWVAEDPEAHLWPPIERAMARAGSPWASARRSVDAQGRLVVELDHVGEGGEGGEGGESPRARLRADALALVGEVAEASTFVRVLDADGAAPGSEPGVAVIDMVTGLLDDETSFASHGHTLRLRVTAR